MKEQPYGIAPWWQARCCKAEARNRELEAAISEYLEQIASEDWTVEDQMLKEVLVGTPPPDAGGEG